MGVHSITAEHISWLLKLHWIMVAPEERFLLYPWAWDDSSYSQNSYRLEPFKAFFRSCDRSMVAILSNSEPWRSAALFRPAEEQRLFLQQVF